jgi:muramoyltetrapeptide carboxypeptidase
MSKMRIAVVAPSCPLKRDAAEAVEAIVAERGDCELIIHPQCFLSDGHFAGSDDARLAALREVMADPSVDAVWFARGGYGSNRIAEEALADLPDAARGKLYLGYSDEGFLLAGFHKAGLDVAWGPMPQDILRGDHGLSDGEAAVRRALDWLVDGDQSALEPELQPPAMAFNLTVLSNLLGTPLEPDFTGVDLLIEEVSEHLYRIDRTMFHLTASANVRRAARIRLGRVGDILKNDPDFGTDEVAIVEDWCARARIPFGGRADIGHDAGNRVVPFGVRAS